MGHPKGSAAKNTAVSKAELSGKPVVAADYGEDEGAGFENLTAQDFAVPFLSIIQGLSAIVQENKPQYNKDARPGMLQNTISGRIYDGKVGVGFVPVHSSHQYTEWVPLKDGGGFKGTLSPDHSRIEAALARNNGQRFGKLTDPDAGTEFIETYNVYGILLGADGPEQIVLAFHSTAIRKYRAWMTRMRSILVARPDGRKVVPPMFAHVWRLGAVAETKPKGTFYSWNIGLYEERAELCRLTPDSPLYQAAQAFRSAAVSGLARAAEDKQAQPVDPDGESSETI